MYRSAVWSRFQSKWCHLTANALATGVYQPRLYTHSGSLMDSVRSDGRYEWIIQQVVPSKIYNRSLNNIYIANDLCKEGQGGQSFIFCTFGIQIQATMRNINEMFSTLAGWYKIFCLCVLFRAQFDSTHTQRKAERKDSISFKRRESREA